MPAPIWSPSYPDNSQLTPRGLQDQQRALQSHPRFLTAQVLLQAAGPRTARALLPDGQVDRAFQALVDDIDMRAGCAAVAQEYDDVLPRAESVLIAGAGHEVDEDDPQAYTRAVLEFVTATPDRASGGPGATARPG